MNFESFKKIHLELSSDCQAACPACSRVYDYSRHIVNRKQDSAWDLKTLKKIFSKDLLENLESLYLCGNYGDPIAFQDLNPWLEEVCSINPNIFITIHTNGGLGTTSSWKKLATILKNRGHLIKFSFDGLEDTNSIYRRGVNWNQAFSNAKSFIESGGKATWKFIEFSHNKHQTEKARQMAAEFNFYKFEVKEPYGDISGLIQTPNSKDLSPDLQIDFSELSVEELNEEIYKGKTQFKEIRCEALIDSMIYIDCEQRVWPCCWLSQDGDHRTRTLKREHFHRLVYDSGISIEFNNLRHHSLVEILNHAFFQKVLPQSWTLESQNALSNFPTCYETCGECTS
ncbi:MAG: hypothetical protein K9K67_08390 [Bacteriovoracaceae bacterium]|nr:hypothetical protein [Bacteriovoracaceae bacterium]